MNFQDIFGGSTKAGNKVWTHAVHLALDSGADDTETTALKVCDARLSGGEFLIEPGEA